MKKLLLLAFIVITASVTNVYSTGKSGSAYSLPQGLSPADYAERTIILKVKNDYRGSCGNSEINISSVKEILNGIGTVALFKIFPNHQPPVNKYNDYGYPLIDLSLIYQLKYSADADLVKTINRFIRTGVFEYAEPKFIPQVTYTPNDPQIGSQYFLGLINAYAAWDISKGDTNIVIGITDTGTDTDHPDLAANIKHNYADPINGVDDDGDGFIDNFSGWDTGENDNDAQVGNCGTCPHGSHVSGCAAAVTDNGTGVASPGFKCKFLPVKIANASGALVGAYEGVTYAADHGCQVINCSWGGGGAGQFGQDVVNYAVINKDAVVVAGAGNNGNNLFFYPAAYDNVVSVAATNTSDIKASFSNYGQTIDVCAPGVGIHSTIYDDNYWPESGTSMASPIVAGCAGILRSQFPLLNAMQIAEKLRVTSDDIYSIGPNSAFANMLGKGRVDLFNALTVNSPSVRAENIIFSDNNDDVFVINDTLRITADFRNYLDATTNLSVTLSSTSPYVQILDNSTTPGVINTMAFHNNSSDPFTVRVLPNAPQNTNILFKFTFTDGSYTDFQMFNEIVNVDYINITVNDVFTTNTSKGRLCYNGEAQTEGLGFNYMEDGTLTYETGLMIGTNNIVSDNFRGDAGLIDDDFVPVLTIQQNDPAVWSDFDTYGTFDDSNSGSPLNISVNHRSFSWSLPPFSKFHIFEYSIHNAGIAALNNVYAGIASDWDIQTFANNKADQDAALKLGYVYCTDPGGRFAGVKVLTPTPFIHYAIDNISGGAGGVDLFNGYSSAEKYLTLSTTRATAGGAGTGNDVIDVVSTGPFTINGGDSVTVAFALIAGDELSDLQNSAQQAQIKYDLVTSLNENNGNISSVLLYPNPAADLATLFFNLKKGSDVKVELFDGPGREISIIKTGVIGPGEHTVTLDLKGLSAGIYFYRVSTDEGSSAGRIIRQ